MRLAFAGLATIAALLLAGCGGGGGSGSAPTPPAPVPTNTLITNLVADQTFTGPAGTTDTSFGPSGTVLTSTSAPGSISVSYNAAAKSYSVSIAGRSQTFTPADSVSEARAGEQVFTKETSGLKERLTLVTSPRFGTTSNRYVGMGFWQQSRLDPATQPERVASFVYGLQTPASAMPRTGQGNFLIDVYALSTVPGFAPSSLDGTGRFDIDFMQGAFSTDTYLKETDLVTGDTRVGGGLRLIGSGLLSSSDPTFSGYVTLDSRHANMSGVLSGRFYGPNANEIGASFTVTDRAGGTATGSFTGQRREGAPQVTLSLTNATVAEQYLAPGATLTFFDYTSDPQARISMREGGLDNRLGGNFRFGPGLSLLPTVDFTSAMLVPGAANFDTYRTTVDGEAVKLELYKIGQANSELALTYVGLGRWQTNIFIGITQREYQSFVYGLETPARLLTARTGTGRYDGVVYGTAANPTTRAFYDVRGSSRYDVDFGRQTYSGFLQLRGLKDDETVDFGRYEFAGSMGYTAETSAPLTYNGEERGELRSRFYGPKGEEIGGRFTIYVPASVHPGGTTIAGVTVARQQQ